jgi:hypothetical protein
MSTHRNSLLIAAVCHAATAAYCQTIGDITQPPWERASEERRAATVEAVDRIRAFPEIPLPVLQTPQPENTTFGAPVTANTDLPEARQRKDAIFKAVVAVMTE